MKLIIDIPEEIYRASQILDVKYEDTVQIPLEVIANGTPLDKIRERISLEKLGYPPSAGYYKAIITVLQIIDKYKAESEEEE